MYHGSWKKGIKALQCGDEGLSLAEDWNFAAWFAVSRNFGDGVDGEGSIYTVSLDWDQISVEVNLINGTVEGIDGPIEETVREIMASEDTMSQWDMADIISAGLRACGIKAAIWLEDRVNDWRRWNDPITTEELRITHSSVVKVVGEEEIAYREYVEGIEEALDLRDWLSEEEEEYLDDIRIRHIGCYGYWNAKEISDIEMEISEIVEEARRVLSEEHDQYMEEMDDAISAMLDALPADLRSR